MCMAVKESIWLSRLLSDLQNTREPKPIVLRIDNNGAIETAKNASVNQRNKHIDLQYHFVRDAYKSNLIGLRHVGSEDQIADSLTKPQDLHLFSKCPQETKTMLQISPKLYWFEGVLKV